MMIIQFNATKQLHTANGPQELNVSFEIKHGNILTLYGPSGAGKTTILRMLAGLTDPDTGLIKMDDQTWFSHRHRRKKLPASRRSIGMVFQDFALFPNLTVRQNLEYAADDRRTDAPLIDELIAMMQLEALQHIAPNRLSGGQQQRVALARAIVRKPRLLLLDEPLSALDDEMRLHLQDHILQVHQRFNLTTILVSHYIPEIIRLSNEVICLDKGRILSHGSPHEVFHQSSSLATILSINPTHALILIANQTVSIPLAPGDQNQLKPGDKVLLVPETLGLHLTPAIPQLP